MAPTPQPTTPAQQHAQAAAGLPPMAPLKPVRKGQNPIVLAAIGTLLMAAWVGTSLFQIATTEAWVLQSTPPDLFKQDWGVILQFKDLFTGNVSGNLGKAIVVAWCIEIITFVFGTVLEVAAHGVHRSSPQMKGLFLFVGFVLLIFNGYTDYAYGSLPSGVCGQVFFAGVMAFIVVFGLPVGLELLIRAKDEFTR